MKITEHLTGAIFGVFIGIACLFTFLTLAIFVLGAATIWSNFSALKFIEIMFDEYKIWLLMYFCALGGYIFGYKMKET